eukprot:XP_001705928.1 Hypothetical protein GL50803_36807 [Giardia lamblia ATCC 50803]
MRGKKEIQGIRVRLRYGLSCNMLLHINGAREITLDLKEDIIKMLSLC